MYRINNFTYYGINPVKVYELPAINQKSFYGKAKVIEDKTGDIFLQSYNTLVCYITAAGEVKRLWDGYSVTTLKHINDFLHLFNKQGGGKKWWISQVVETH